jgi:hypothetical protein
VPRISALLFLIFAFVIDAHAQESSRWFAAAEAGYTRTWDDEGLLGGGLGLGGTVGYRLTARLRLQALVHRIPYYRDVEHLTFDGRIWFTGGEVAFESTTGVARPFVTAGAGVFNDDGVWIQKTLIAPGLTRVDIEVPRQYTLSAMTASGGLEFPLGRRWSLRPGLRFYGLIDTGDDLAPHIILEPSAALAWRW